MNRLGECPQVHFVALVVTISIRLIRSIPMHQHVPSS